MKFYETHFFNCYTIISSYISKNITKIFTTWYFCSSFTNQPIFSLGRRGLTWENNKKNANVVYLGVFLRFSGPVATATTSDLDVLSENLGLCFSRNLLVCCLCDVFGSLVRWLCISHGLNIYLGVICGGKIFWYGFWYFLPKVVTYDNQSILPSSNE